MTSQNPRSTSPVAMITGASRGIGRSVAIKLAKAGYRLALIGRDQQALNETYAACKNLTAKVTTHFCDLAQKEALTQLMNDVTTAHERLDVLINNAGVGGSGKVGEADLQRWDVCIQTNLVAVMHLSHLAANFIRQSPSGGIITIGSIASRTTYGGGGAYCATKHAVLGFSGCMFEDLRESGVKVSVICPGFVDTEMVTAKNLNRDKMISPDDVADAVMFVLQSSPRVCPTEIVLRPLKSPYV